METQKHVPILPAGGVVQAAIYWTIASERGPWTLLSSLWRYQCFANGLDPFMVRHVEKHKIACELPIDSAPTPRSPEKLRLGPPVDLALGFLTAASLAQVPPKSSGGGWFLRKRHSNRRLLRKCQEAALCRHRSATSWGHPLKAKPSRARLEYNAAKAYGPFFVRAPVRCLKNGQEKK